MICTARYARVSAAQLLRFACFALLFVAARAQAQVGYVPAKSPYEDLKPTQDLTVFFGRFGSSPGVAGVLPKASVFGGFRYDIPVGGPASLFARYAYVPSERTYLLPANPKPNRFLGTVKTTTNIADVGLAIALTGRKTFHHFVPSLQGGIGLASNPAKIDTGLYKFGTKFTITYGANLHYIFRNGWGLRGDATNYFWQNQYPAEYAIPASDATAVLTSTAQRTGWSSNWTFTLGVSIPIVR